MKENTIKDIFLEGAIPPELVAQNISRHACKTQIGGHSIFLGQVREDLVSGKKITAIAFTAHKKMALKSAGELREEIIRKYSLSCAHIYHSLGTVEAGGICLFVFTSARHRKQAIQACEELVDRIKAEVAIWGKEIAQDGTHFWKENP